MSAAYEPFQVVHAKVMYRNCADARPWLIVRVLPECLQCFPISTKDYGQMAFAIEEGSADFAATGLTRACFVLYERVIEVRYDEVMKRRGVLGGEMLARFREVAGV